MSCFHWKCESNKCFWSFIDKTYSIHRIYLLARKLAVMTRREDQLCGKQQKLFVLLPKKLLRQNVRTCEKHSQSHTEFHRQTQKFAIGNCSQAQERHIGNALMEHAVLLFIPINRLLNCECIQFIQFLIWQWKKMKKKTAQSMHKNCIVCVSVFWSESHRNGRDRIYFAVRGKETQSSNWVDVSNNLMYAKHEIYCCILWQFVCALASTHIQDRIYMAHYASHTFQTFWHSIVFENGNRFLLQFAQNVLCVQVLLAFAGRAASCNFSVNSIFQMQGINQRS